MAKKLYPKRKGILVGQEANAASIITHMIRNGAVVADTIAANAVSEAKIADASIVAAKLAESAVEEAKIATDAVTAAKIAVSGLDGTTGDVAANHIVANMLQTDCVTSVKIQADAVTATKINVVGLDGATGRIIVADVTDANAVTGGVNSYATTLISAGKILISGATALSDWSHASNATLIDGGDIYTGTVTATQIAANAIITDKIIAGAVIPAKTSQGIAWTFTGDYSGDNTNDRQIALAYKCYAVFIQRADVAWQWICMSTAFAQVHHTTAPGHAYITYVLLHATDGFIVGSVANTSGKTYRYVAICGP